MPETEPLPEEAFWRFSLAFYALPDVARALIALQDRHGLDVNLMLFALWLGISGRGRLGKDTSAAGERAAATVRDEIVEPLRSLRRRLRQHPDADVQRLREGVQALELEGEKLVQRRLVHLAGPGLGDIPAEERRVTALANLAAYLGAEKARSAEAMVICDALGSFIGNPASDPLSQAIRPSV